MEKAVLKTLIYYDIFNFPLKAWEVHKWLIGKSASLKQVEKTLKKLGQASRVKYQGDYWFLPNRRGLVKDRLERERVSAKHLRIAKFMAALFKLIPWIKLVGVSGSLGMMGSSSRDDIDLFIITSRKRIWVSRILLIILTGITGLRRNRREKLLQVSGKICINLILDIDTLESNKKNIYLAHEVLQMRPIWQRERIYSKFLHDNSWAFKYLPNWKSGVIESRKSKVESQKYNLKFKRLEYFFDFLEIETKRLQLKIMNSPTGNERIESGALYFHPEDKGIKILAEYDRKVMSL